MPERERDCVSIPFSSPMFPHCPWLQRKLTLTHQAEMGGSCFIWIMFGCSFGDVEFVSLSIAIVLCLTLFCVALCSIFWWPAAMTCTFLLLENASGKELVITGVFIEFPSELVRASRLDLQLVSNQFLTTSLIDFTLLSWANSMVWTDHDFHRFWRPADVHIICSPGGVYFPARDSGFTAYGLCWAWLGLCVWHLVQHDSVGVFPIKDNLVARLIGSMLYGFRIAVCIHCDTSPMTHPQIRKYSS